MQKFKVVEVRTDNSKYLIDADIAHFADQIHELRNTRGPYEVFEACLEYWRKTNPTKYDSFLIEIKNLKDTRHSPTGSNKNKTLRYLLDIPNLVVQMFRTQYSPDEFKMDQKFFREIAKRFPALKVAEKL